MLWWQNELVAHAQSHVSAVSLQRYIKVINNNNSNNSQYRPWTQSELKAISHYVVGTKTSENSQCKQ